MIYWLIQSTAADPELARGQPPLGLLNASEQARFSALRTPKRQHDWLLGRCAAKRLVQRFLAETSGCAVALATIEIKNEDDGSPFVEITGQGADTGLDGRGRLGLCLTISHCEELAFCAAAAVDFPDAIGADIERVRPRAWNFVETFFTEAEIQQVQAAPPAWRDTLTTAIWSAKEAALKAVKLGLTVDTRRVDCRFDLNRLPQDEWLPLQATYTPYASAGGETMYGWWRTCDGFVLTLMGPDGMTPQA